VQSLAVVEALDVGEQVASGLVAGGIGPVVDQLGLQYVKKLFIGALSSRL